MHAILDFLREIVRDWQRHNALTQGAALAYYALFSLTPLLVLVILVAALALGRAAAQGQVVAHIQGFVGTDTAQAVEQMVQRASAPRAGIVPALVSFAAILLGASGLVGQLRAALNHIWGVPTSAGGFRAMILQRLKALAVVGGIGLLLVLSMVFSAVLAALHGMLVARLPVLGPLLPNLNFALSMLLSTAFFAIIFHLLPDAALRWRDVWLGALVTAILFTLGKSLIGLYLGRAGTTAFYGAAGSLVLLLLWIYYSTQILLVGAEFTQVYARYFGSQRPDARG